MEDRINIRHIRFFLEVARRQSVIAASEHLGVAQPAVSRSLKELETILGVQLLHRSRRGSHLTPRGEEFYQLVSAGMEKFVGAYENASARKRHREHITVGALPTASARFIPTVIVNLRQQGYEATISVLQGQNPDILAKLRRNEIPIVIGRLGAAEDMVGLSFEQLFHETLECVARPTHPLANAANIQTRDVANLPLILGMPKTAFRSEIDRQFQSSGVVELPDVVETNSITFARSLVQMQDRIWIVPKGIVAEDVRSGSLCSISVQDWEVRGPVGISRNPKAETAPVVEEFIQEARRCAETFT